MELNFWEYGISDFRSLQSCMHIIENLIHRFDRELANAFSSARFLLNRFLDVGNIWIKNAILGFLSFLAI